MRLKTDSFVVESNVHFPTDYNLLSDSARKCIDMVMKLQESYDLEGWRKIKSWRRELKNKMRVLGRAVSSGGKRQIGKSKKTTEEYLKKAKSLYSKLEKGKGKFPAVSLKDYFIIRELEYLMSFLL